jgi:hypothetical protein
MKTLTTALRAAAIATLLTGCGPGGDREFREAGDSPRAAPAALPTPGMPVDSTAGVARSSGRPGVAGDTVSRPSKISAPPRNTPDAKRP